MIINRTEIIKRYEAGLRIASADNNIVSQHLAIAKYIMAEQIQKPIPEMMTMILPNGNIAVRGKPFKVRSETNNNL